MDSFNAIYTEIEPYLASRHLLYRAGRGSIADNLEYTSKYNAYDSQGGAQGLILVTDRIRDRTVVILDDVVLDKIQNEPGFAESLERHQCVLIEPRGLTDGMNMFNTPNAEVIRDRTATVLRRAQEILAESGGTMSFDDAVTAALGQRTESILADDAHPDLRPLVRSVVDPGASAGQSSEEIARSLNGSAGITEREVQQALEKLPDADKQALARELLVHQGEVVSPRRFAQRLTEQHEMLMQMAADRGIDPSNVYFLIPRPQHSFGMMAMAHRAVTGTPLDRYVDGRSDLPRVPSHAMVVILDDVAGSGTTSVGETDLALQAGFPGPIVMSPLLSTEQAEAKFHRQYEPSEPQQPRFAPVEMVRALESSPFFQGLNEEEQRELKRIVGSPGWGENALSMAFPYMAPDNDNLFFADLFARYFILNRNRDASKTTGTYDYY